MGYHDNLPPGVSVGMIPGNRPEDEAWEREVERWTPIAVIEVCSAANGSCEHAEWAMCPVCDGEGIDDIEGLRACPACGGEGDTFHRCSLNVWTAGIGVSPEQVIEKNLPYEVHNLTDCPTIAQDINDAVIEAAYGRQEDYRDDE
jgi:hypothetical protein